MIGLDDYLDDDDPDDDDDDDRPFPSPGGYIEALCRALDGIDDPDDTDDVEIALGRGGVMRSLLLSLLEGALGELTPLARDRYWARFLAENDAAGLVAAVRAQERGDAPPQGQDPAWLQAVQRFAAREARRLKN
jgi:hypothetical protein